MNNINQQQFTDNDMRKILAGFLLAIIVGVPAIYFGVPAWAQYRAQRQVDATFAALATSIGKASHGAVSYDIWSRTLKIADIAVQSSDAAPTTLKAAQVVMTGAGLPEPGRLVADRIDITDAEVSGLQLGTDGPRTTYRSPKIVIDTFSGPTTFERRSTAIAGAQTMLALFEAATASSATQISIPALSATVTPAQTRGGASDEVAEYGLSDLTLRNLSAGHVGATTIERLVMTGGVPEAGAYTADIEKFAATDIDLTAMIPILDPAQRKDDGYRTIYRTASTGTYRISLNKTSVVRFDSVRLDDVALRPSTFSDPAVLALSSGLRIASPSLSPAEVKALSEKLATIYEGIRIAKFEARGFAVHVAPVAAAKIAVIRFTNLENGRLGELAVEGVDTQFAPGEPVKIGRAAIKEIDLVKIARTSSQIAPGAAPSGAQALRLLEMFRGFELNGIQIPQRGAAPPVQVETLSASWDKFVGPFPTQVHVSSKVRTTIDPATADPGVRFFSNGETRDLTISLDLGAAWNDATQTLMLSPLSANIAGLYDAAAKVTIKNVPPALFSTDPATVAQTSAQLEVGRIEVSLHDLGGLELMLAKIAKERQTAPADIRKSFAETARAYAAANPDMQTTAAAVARLLDTSGATLNIVLVPKQRLRVGDAIEIGRTLPSALLSQFDIEASTDK